MFFIWGGQKHEAKAIGHLKRMCPVCGRETSFTKYEIVATTDVYFIPVWESKQGVFIQCDVCGNQFEDEVITLPGGKTDKVKKLIAKLKGKPGVYDKDAAEKLVKIGTSAVPALIEALEDDNTNVRVGVAWILGEIGDKRAVPALVESLQDQVVEVRASTAGALIYTADKRAYSALLGALMDKDYRVRSNAVMALGNIGDKRAVPVLIECLQDQIKVQINATGALIVIGDKQAIPAIEESVKKLQRGSLYRDVVQKLAEALEQFKTTGLGVGVSKAELKRIEKEKIICPKCRVKNKEEANFCAACGAKLK